MAGLSQDDFTSVSAEIKQAWDRAQTRDQAFHIITEYGRKYGYKNVIAAIENRTPKRFTREKPVSEWLEERRRDESAE